MAHIFKPRRGLASTNANTILASGEFFCEYGPEGIGKGPVKVKFGDGETKYSQLPYAWGDTPVNNGTLTIQKNGTNAGTFTANQSTDEIANITVPTKTSDLTNDSGFVTGPIRTDQLVTYFYKKSENITFVTPANRSATNVVTLLNSVWAGEVYCISINSDGISKFRIGDTGDTNSHDFECSTIFVVPGTMDGRPLTIYGIPYSTSTSQQSARCVVSVFQIGEPQ